MKEIIIGSVHEFHKAVRSQMSVHAVYRGEDRATYELLPKMGRLRRINSWNSLGRECNMLKAFKKRALPFLRERPTNDWEWLAIGQHYGLPTRLFDWTLNPLVAAYFASVGGRRIDAAIYVIDYYDIGQADETVHPFELKEDVLYAPPHLSTRFTAQHGIFTAHHQPEKSFTPKSLQRWTLKGECLSEIWSTVGMYGISPATIFPDLSGLCEELALH